MQSAHALKVGYALYLVNGDCHKCKSVSASEHIDAFLAQIVVGVSVGNADNAQSIVGGHSEGILQLFNLERILAVVGFGYLHTLVPQQSLALEVECRVCSAAQR